MHDILYCTCSQYLHIMEMCFKCLALTLTVVVVHGLGSQVLVNIMLIRVVSKKDYHLD